jgi:hypothetical protein
MDQMDVVNQIIVDFLIDKIAAEKKNKKPGNKVIAKKIGITEGYLSNIINGQKFKDEFRKKVFKAFPELERKLNWSSVSDPEQQYNGSNRGNKLLPEIPNDPSGKRIPVIDATVYASIVSVLTGSITLPPDTFIRIPIFSEGEAAVLVHGHSMKGYINQGDWIIIKRLTDRRSVMYGEPHLVVTKADNLQTVKFLKPAEEDDMLTLVPYNIEQFEPQTVYKDDILAIYRVIGSFRSH